MIEPGTLLQNRYRVTQQIGQGGMGAVYIATDERFHSTVAIKQTFFFDDPTLCKAFEREARLLNHLRHAALPKVSDHFTEGTGQFLVMEFIEGSDLSVLLRERNSAFPVADVLCWADQLLDVLDYLHEQEPPVIHRDIKPQNIKLTTSGHIVLLDFGLAKGTPAKTLTSVTGSVLGYSPLYAPLEQVQGTGTNPCSDIYSLGATLYHLLAGIPPVDALTRAGAVINQQPDPLRPAHIVNTEVPAAVGKVIQRAMAQKSTLRPKTAAEMREMLRQALNASPQAARKAPAAPIIARSPNATFEETVVEARAQTPNGSLHAALDETTVDAKGWDARRGAARHQTALPVHAPLQSSHRSPARLLIVAAVLAICAVAAFTIIPRSNPATLKTDSQSGGSLQSLTDARTDTPAAMPSASAGGDADALNGAAPAQLQSTTSNVSSAVPANDARNRTDNSQRTADSSKADGSVEGSGMVNNPSPAGGSATSNRPTLQIQQPAPTSQPDDVTPFVEEDTRRAEEHRSRQPLMPPPHDGGHRPPPPPPGSHPPPRRPPHHP